ncbi:MAG: TIGR04086 family membrane protein [Eubacteriales bacterium]|nr:TIGR04086 family membrane protein [Eubacteriales bacterium]
MQKRFSVILKCSLLSDILALLLSLLLSACIFYMDIPDKAITAILFFIIVLSGMAGGYTGAKVMETKGLLTGGTISIIFYIFLCMISAVLNNSLQLNTHMLIILLTATVSGMLGGVLGMPR